MTEKDYVSESSFKKRKERGRSRLPWTQKETDWIVQKPWIESSLCRVLLRKRKFANKTKKKNQDF